MATYTRIQLRNQVMEDLGLIDANHAPEAEDAVLVDSRCQQKLEELNDEGLIPFDLDANTIPAKFMQPLSQVICPGVAGAFGLDAKRAMLEGLKEDGMRRLYKLKQAADYGSVVRADYF